ncbi:PREDICTED: eukaryotic translation initiation factor 2D [Nelumbo nucifera]|uniref:Eukaryotic translation initiation factor 2D n=1 Tax=Nelumbo nucifera TaxID=4432 RepID=A0A1U7Z5X8_NELNU|nr:PREDICTED: eukaryotic translation initiation factor 2D [Nelumbo nucifera]XP_010247738.1 PREDICTED: eukaryotic translation initiation factor 2D [Nelumbo nucifera]
MFKKSIEAKSLQRLSGADRKKLKRTVKERFPQASDADIDAILPPKVEITVAKFPNRVLVYGVEGGFPMLFDVDGRGNEIFPTVYALWKVPELLPAFILKGGEVSRFVIGGADLMFPGISIPAEGLPSFLAGEAWAVKVPSNPAPIAVGSTTMSSVEALKVGLRGKALRITHYYRDSLWESAEGHYVPNAGFLEDVVLQDPALLPVCQTSDKCTDANNASSDEQNGTDKAEKGELVDVQDIHQEEELATSIQTDIKDPIEEITTEMSGLKATDDISTEELNGEKEQHALSSEEVDMLLDKCLLQALRTSVTDKYLPMPGSILWSNHVLPCRPPGTTLDIKKSSHKKLSKWLHSKASAGWVVVKEDKYKKEVILFSVNRKHKDYISFIPEKRQEEIVDDTSDPSASDGRHQRKQLEVAEIYKSSVHVNPIFASLGIDTGKFFTAAEATDIVFRYVESQHLAKGGLDKAIVVLDATLCDALYKGTVKKGSSYPTEIHKKDLGGMFLSRMQAHYRVTRGNESVVRKGALKSIQIMTERRQGNKKVTRVSGLESFLVDAEVLASELQKKFACSTSVAELPGKKGYEVLVQGGVIDDLARHLVEHYGIPKRYIEVLDKTKK